MTNFAIGNVAPWKLNSMVEILMAQTGIEDPTKIVELVMSGDLRVTRYRLEWKVIDGGIMELPSYRTDGMPLEHCVEDLTSRGYHIGGLELLKESYPCSERDTLRKVVVLPGEWIRQNVGTTEKELRDYAARREWLAPLVEDALILRNMLTDGVLEQMNLHGVMTMHIPYVTKMHEPYVTPPEIGENVETEWLFISYRFDGGRQLHPEPSRAVPGSRRISRTLGYAFIVP